MNGNFKIFFLSVSNVFLIFIAYHWRTLLLTGGESERLPVKLPVTGLLFIMRPHTDYFNSFFFLNYLIDQTMLNIYAPGICSGQISNKLFIWRGGLKGIVL